MGMNFPSAPLFGELYPNPAVPEKPQYKWDGTTWTAVGDSAGGSGVFVSDTEPTPVPDGSLWWKSNQGTLNIKYNDGDTTQWTEAVAIPVPDMTWAAPFDAMAYSGMQVNGGFEVTQENSGIITLTKDVSKHYADNWLGSFSHPSAVFTIGSFAAGTLGVDGPYFPRMTEFKAATPMATVSANDNAFIYTRIEGYRFARAGWGTTGAQPITIGFWVYTDVAGTFCVTTSSETSQRSYVTEVVSAAATWQYKTVTIPGDVTGTWAKDNTTGTIVYFTFACGATLQGAANAWTAGIKIASPAISNFFSTSKSIYITGVTVFPGTAAPTAAQSSRIMRPFDQELVTCQRYFLKTLGRSLKGVVLQGYGPAAITMTAPTTFRATPSLSLSGTIQIMDGSTGGGQINGIAANYSSMDIIGFNPTVAAGHTFATPGLPIVVNVGGTTGFLIVDARL